MPVAHRARSTRSASSTPTSRRRPTRRWSASSPERRAPAPAPDVAAAPPTRPGCDIEVEIPVGGVILAGHLHLPEHPIGVVVFAHGSGSSRHSPRNRFVASVLNEAGIGHPAVRPAHAGRGARPGQRVRHRAARPRRLVAHDRWLARRADVGGLAASATSAPAPAPRRRCGPPREPGVRIVGAVVSRGGRPDLAGPRLGQVHGPTLLIVGGADTTVLGLNRTGRPRLRLRGRGRLVVVPGATHLFEEPGTLRGRRRSRHATGSPATSPHAARSRTPVGHRGALVTTTRAAGPDPDRRAGRDPGARPARSPPWPTSTPLVEAGRRRRSRLPRRGVARHARVLRLAMRAQPAAHRASTGSRLDRGRGRLAGLLAGEPVGAGPGRARPRRAASCSARLRAVADVDVGERGGRRLPRLAAGGQRAPCPSRDRSASTVSTCTPCGTRSARSSLARGARTRGGAGRDARLAVLRPLRRGPPGVRLEHPAGAARRASTTWSTSSSRCAGARRRHSTTTRTPSTPAERRGRGRCRALLPGDGAG